MERPEAREQVFEFRGDGAMAGHGGGGEIGSGDRCEDMVEERELLAIDHEGERVKRLADRCERVGRDRLEAQLRLSSKATRS